MPVKVLVADDSPTIRRRATSTLGDAGYEVTCVEDSEAAWGQLENGGPFDILLCDILMPGMDGYDLCHRVKSHATMSRLPVLLLRGTFEPWDQARAEAAGADGFITKPFDADALLSTLREVLAGAAAAEAAPAAAPAPRTEEPLGGSPFGDAEDVVDTAVFAPEDPLHVDDAGAGSPLAAVAEPLIEPEPLAAIAEPAVFAAPPPAFTPAPAPVVAVAPPPAPPRQVAPAPPTVAASVAATTGEMPPIDDALLDRIAERVVQRLSTEILERIAWEVVPDVAEALVRKRLLEIEGAVADD